MGVSGVFRVYSGLLSQNRTMINRCELLGAYVFSDNVEEHLRNICLKIEYRFDYIRFLEIGGD